MKRVEALRAIEEVAADQAGLVTSAQAAASGVGRMTQRRLVEAGLLENVGRGVYRMAGAPPPSHLEARVAWLRLDPATPAWKRDSLGPDDGVVSHRSACLLHDLGDIPAPHIELTVPRRRTTREPGVRLHTGSLVPADITFVDGLPVTTAQKTIVDLLENRADGAHVGAVIADADRRGLIDPDSLAGQVARFGRRYGLPRANGADLLTALTEQAGQRLSATEVQQAMLAGVLAGSGVSDSIINTVTPTNAAALAAIAKVWEKPQYQKLLAEITRTLMPNNQRALATITRTMAPANDTILAAIRQALVPEAQVMTAQAVAAILSNPSLTAQMQQMRAPIAELAVRALRQGRTGTPITDPHDDDRSPDTDDQE